MRTVFVFLASLVSLSAFAVPADIRLHSSDSTSLAARIESIQRATRNIDIETFYFQPDIIGNRVLAELIRAHQKNPQMPIRLLLDGWGSAGFSSNLACDLKNKGISVKFYNRTRDLIHKGGTHRKIWIADDTAIVGGRNLSAEHFSVDGATALSDWDLEIKGPLVNAIQSSFEQGWNSQQSKPPSCAHFSPYDFTDIDASMGRPLPEIESSMPDWISTAAQWYADSLGTRTSSHVAYQATAELLHSAQQSLSVENAYFLPVDKIFSELTLAHKREVKIDFYLNGPRPGYWMGELSSCLPLRDIEYWIRENARVTIVPKNHRTHAKALLVDDRALAIGSFNWDAWSIRLNAETLLVTDSPPLIQQFKAEHERRMDVGIKATGLEEIFSAYQMTSRQIFKCKAESRLKPILKNFF